MQYTRLIANSSSSLELDSNMLEKLRMNERQDLVYWRIGKSMAYSLGTWLAVCMARGELLERLESEHVLPRQ